MEDNGFPHYIGLQYKTCYITIQILAKGTGIM